MKHNLMQREGTVGSDWFLNILRENILWGLSEREREEVIINMQRFVGDLL